MRWRNGIAAVLLTLAWEGAAALDLAGAWRAALAADHEYGAARAAGLAGQTRRAQADGLWRPEVALAATAGIGIAETATSGARFAAPGFGQSNGVSFNTSVNHGASGRLALTARHPLISAERQAAGRRLEIGAEAATREVEAARQALGLRVAETYFDLAVAAESARVLARQRTAVDRALEQARERFALGDVPVTDVHEAAARAEAVRAQVLAAQTEIAVRRAALADITGLDADGLAAAAPVRAVPLADLPALPAALAAADAGSPLLRLRAADVEAARQEAARQAAGAGTAVDLVAQFARDRIAGSGDFGSATAGATSGLVGVQISVPFDLGGVRRARHAEALHLVEKAEAELRRARQQVAAQARAAWLALDAGRARLGALAEAHKASLARLDATRLGRAVGHRTTLDLLNAEADAAQAELGLLRARVALAMDRLRLAAAGGAIDEALLTAIDTTLEPASGG
ncbi:MAG: TolC family protein [Burkholderiales bacterium]|nr:TolC family protein [Burkholderiales bacterium]